MTLFSGVADELSTLHGCLIDEFAFLDTALTAIIDGYAPKEDPERPWPRIFDSRKYETGPEDVDHHQ